MVQLQLTGLRILLSVLKYILRCCLTLNCDSIFDVIWLNSLSSSCSLPSLTILLISNFGFNAYLELFFFVLQQTLAK